MSSWRAYSRKPYQLLQKNVGSISGNGTYYDTLENIKKGQAEMLTEHLNQVYNTGNIKFTFEEEENGSIAFLDTKLTRKEDGKVTV